MVKCLFWKAQVVRRLAVVLAASLLVIPQAKSQSSPQMLQQKITLSCNALQFQDVIKKLEGMTGLHFVYSSNKIPINKPVSLKLSDKPLDEVLILLGSQMNLVFKRKDQHIVIKTAEKISPDSNQPKQLIKVPEIKVKPASEQKSLESLADIGDQFSTLPGAKNTLKYPTTLLGSNHFKHNKDLSLYFDTARLSGLTKNDIEKINIKNNNRGLFVSSGFVINDYSLGAEFQAGLRAVHVVYSPSWLKDSRFHSAYGLGTSVPLKRSISINIVYTYAHLRDKRTNSSQTVGSMSTDNLAFSAKHHQVKLMMQYAFTKNINLRTGLTINNMVTTYHLPNEYVIEFTEDVKTNLPISSGSSSVTPFDGAPVLPKSSGTTIQTLDMWMSWEATVSYKINFDKR